jgi:hypothetical protein
MTMSTLDVLIVAPGIPLAPVVLTWWLPWERWIPWGKLPKGVLGPYALYVSFAAWHFRFYWWFVLATFLVGASLSIVAILEQIMERIGVR